MMIGPIRKKHVSELNTVELKKVLQKQKITKLLYLNKALTNPDINSQMGLSTPKIISLLNELKSESIVEEIGQADSSGGRRPVLYGLKKDALYTVGITINLYRTTIFIFDGRNEAICEPEIVNINISEGVGIIDQIVARTNALIERQKIDHHKIVGAGIEIPGLVNYELGVNFTHLKTSRPLLEVFQEKLALPVVIENDAKARTYAELKFGSARDRKNVLVLELDWGIGLGMVLNGKLYRGKNSLAGEFGHLPMIENDILCGCGKKGCLETIASGTAIARMAREGIRAGKSSMLTRLVNEDLDKIEPKTVVEAANAGDQYSITILTGVGEWLGKSIAFLIQIFNPELIVLSGRVSNAGQYILTPIQQAINIYCNPDLSKEVKIRISELDKYAGVRGVTAMLMEKVMGKIETK
ncbi:MAG: ROK family protein [Prolixibacteraceae bacterium]|jgi:glucokinase-like ROK family protein|nr:ROK family protein [Prolixibacteraceae bacterium]